MLQGLDYYKRYAARFGLLQKECCKIWILTNSMLQDLDHYKQYTARFGLLQTVCCKIWFLRTVCYKIWIITNGMLQDFDYYKRYSARFGLDKFQLVSWEDALSEEHKYDSINKEEKGYE